MNKEKIASIAKQLILLAVVYPVFLVALLRVVSLYVEPPFVWMVGLFSWAAFTILFMRYALGVKMRHTVTSFFLRPFRRR